MAEKINYQLKLKTEYPEVWKSVVRIAESINELNRHYGLPEQSIKQLTDFEIVITDNMTEEEKDMQYIQYYLKRGCSFEKAKEKAKERKTWIKEMFDRIEE